MHDTSARLVERVLPAASYRQWVLTVPFPLRLRIARDPGELSRVLNLFHRALRAELRRRARRLGLPVGEPAAMTFVQRFGGALNLHVHFHAIVAEALFANDGDAVQRIDLPQPSDENVRCVLARLVRKLHRARTPGVEEPAPDALGQAQQRSMQSTWVTSLLDERGIGV